MFNVGDKVKFGKFSGKIIRVNRDKQIGFSAELSRTSTYNILIEGITEDDFKEKKEVNDGTCETSDGLPVGEETKSD